MITHVNRRSPILFALTALSLCTALLTGGCSSSGGDVVAKIGSYSLTLPEYERQYLKNNGGQAAADTSTFPGRMDFLQLLIKYRLKVLEARDQGYEKDPDIQRELQEYRNSLAVPFLTERVVIDPQLRVLHERRKTEVRAAHILIRVQPDSTGVIDTLKAWNEAQRILALARGGERFDSLAARFSEDPGSSKNGGDLMYFSAGMTVPVFDDAVYNMKVGELLGHPVRTMFGYHLIKVLDKRPARGELQVSHILTRFPVENPTDTAAAYAKIRLISDSLRNGVSFQDLAMRNSEDPVSGAKGGDLGWIARRRTVPEFESAAFDLPKGVVSGPVKTPFGYHIILVTDERAAKAFDESKQELKQIYQRYGFEEDNAAFVAGVEKKYGMTVSEPAIERIALEVDTASTTSVAGWYSKMTDATKALPLVTFTGSAFTVDEAVRIVEKNRDYQSRPLNRNSLRELARTLGQKSALERETQDLETRYPEFAELMQEYREGVLLFRAEQEFVWNKVAVKDSALRLFWGERASEYRWPDRYAVREIFVTSDSLANVLRDSLNNGVDFGELAARHTQRAGYKEKKGDWGLLVPEKEELARKVQGLQVGWIEGPFKHQYGYSIVKLEGREPARDKTFEEAQSEVSSRFQEFEHKRIERDWIELLTRKFGLTVSEESVRNAFRDVRKKS